jgi:sulfur transfer protein SufE
MIDYFEEKASELSLLTGRQRLEHIIQKGEQHGRLESERRTKENKVEGCQSNAYLIVTQDDTVTVETDADSKIVRGYLAYLSEGLTGLPADTVIDEARDSVEQFVVNGGLESTFTPNRSDAFTNAVEAIIDRLRSTRVETKH